MNSRRPSCSSSGSRTHGSDRNNRSNNHGNRTNRRPGRSFLPPSLLLSPQNERNGSDTLSDAISALRSPKRRKKCVEEQEPQQQQKKDDDSSKPQTPPASSSNTNNDGSSDTNSTGAIDPNERKRKGISSGSTATTSSSSSAHQQNSPPGSTTTTASGGWEWTIGILPPAAPNKKGPEQNHRYPTRRRIPSLLYASFLSGLTASEYERQEGRISIRHHQHAGKQATMTK